MRLAFASCMYLADNSTQDVWNQLLKRHQETKIDHLLLLGDQVYTGFGFSDANRKPQRTWPQQQFLDTLYKEYKAQFEVPSFKALLRAMAASGGTVQITWDDHDFGYNNAFGSDVAFAANKPISSALFTSF